MDDANSMQESAAKDASEPLVEVRLCVYAGGKLALQMDDGKKVPVPDLDTAIAAIRRVVETESEGPLERPEKPDMNAAPEESAETEQAFTEGYRGPSGY